MQQLHSVGGAQAASEATALRRAWQIDSLATPLRPRAFRKSGIAAYPIRIMRILIRRDARVLCACGCGLGGLDTGWLRLVLDAGGPTIGI